MRMIILIVVPILLPFGDGQSKKQCRAYSSNKHLSSSSTATTKKQLKTQTRLSSKK